MLNTNEKVIKHKVGLLNLAKELGNMSKACQVMGLSRDTFYRYKAAVEEGGVESLIERPRRKPNLRNRIGPKVEQAVIDYALEAPAQGQVRASNELRKRGISVSPTGVRGAWLRNNLACFRDRLRALEEKMAAEGLMLTESQLAALEKKRHDDEAAGEIETAIWVISVRRTLSRLVGSRVSDAFTSRPLSIPIARLRPPSCIRRKRRSPRPTCPTTGCCRCSNVTRCRCCGF